MRALWYSSRFRAFIVQAALLGGLIALIWWIAGNTAQNLAERGIRTGFDYLWRPARFPISESIVTYDPADNFLWAYVVGLGNTLWLSFITIILSTLLGLFVGLSRRSQHPLLSTLAGIYVSVMRNVPLIVQLLFWYGIATTLFPGPKQALNPLPGLFLSLRGVYAPSLTLGPGSGFILLVGALLLILFLTASMRITKDKGIVRIAALPLAFLFWAAAFWLLARSFGSPIGIESPELKGLNFRGGMQLSPEFAAIIVGLTLYAAAFVGEIIRGGIEAVAKGQWEGGRSLGLGEREIMFRIILPQALRVIVPPMTSQYLSTVKNTTLAVAVGYPELGLVVNTVINQTGQAIESIIIMLGVFLTISLSVSVLMNWYNRRVAIVVR